MRLLWGSDVSFLSGGRLTQPASPAAMPERGVQREVTSVKVGDRQPLIQRN